jgi:protein gp37
MADNSKIAWTDASWNPVRGCCPVSAGCRHCYAARFAHRFNGPGQPYEGLTAKGRNGPLEPVDLTRIPIVPYVVHLNALTGHVQA